MKTGKIAGWFILGILTAGFTVSAKEKKTEPWQQSIVLKDYMQLYDFPEELLSYPVTFDGSFEKKHLKVLVDNVATEYQLTDVVERSGKLVSATVHFRTALNKGQTKNILLINDSKYKADFATHIRISDATAGGTAVLSGNNQKVKVPYGSRSITGNAFNADDAPVIQIGGASGKLIGKGTITAGGADNSSLLQQGSLLSTYNEDVAPVNKNASSEPDGAVCNERTGFWLLQGNLFSVYRVDYRFGKRHYYVDLTITHNEEYIKIDEHIELNGGEAFDLNSAPVFKFSLKENLDPAYRLGLANGAYQNASGRYGRIPYQQWTDVKVGPDTYYSTPWTFYNPMAENAILFVPYRFADWKYSWYGVWNNTPTEEMLTFYEYNGDKYMQTGMFSPERHWAISVIPTGKVVINGHYNSDLTKDVLPTEHTYTPQLETDASGEITGFAGTDDSGNTYPFHRNDQWGAGPEVRLWQKLTDFSLNTCKDLALDFTEDINKGFNLPGIPDYPGYDYAKYKSEYEKDFRELADRYWNNMGPNHFGWSKAHESVKYAQNRKNWSQAQREHIRSWYVFYTTAIARGEVSLAGRFSAWLGGQPNFIVQWMKALDIYAVIFREHPFAPEWKTTSVEAFDKVFDYYVKEADPANNAVGGRYVENPICYNYASMEDIMFANDALMKYDGTNLFTNPNAQKWLKWNLDILVPGNEIARGQRIAPSEGAHARISGLLKGERLYESLHEAAKQLIRLDDANAKEIGNGILWSMTEGADGATEGVNPRLKSTLYAEYGPIMRYDFGGPREAFLHLSQIDTRNYRWGSLRSDILSGMIFYSADKKSWSWNKKEAAGDESDPNAMTNFIADDGFGIRNAPSTGVLYDFDFAQEYYATANVLSKLNGRGVMMVRDDYIAVLDDVKDKIHTKAKFTWVNEADEGLKIEHFAGTDFAESNRRNTYVGLMPGGDARFPIRYNPQQDDDSGKSLWKGSGLTETELDNFSVRFTGNMRPKSETFTFALGLGPDDTATLTIDGKTYIQNGMDDATATISGLDLNLYYDFKMEYKHSRAGRIRCVLYWKEGSSGPPTTGGSNAFETANLINWLSMPDIFPALESAPKTGDQLHIVSPSGKGLKVVSQPWGAQITNAGQTEYVFFSSANQTPSLTGAEFNGQWGYARANQLAIFKGVKIRFGDFKIETAGGDFGVSADYRNGKITGGFAGISGGTVHITLPKGFAANPTVKMDGKTVASATKNGITTFTVVISKSEGTKNYTIE